MENKRGNRKEMKLIIIENYEKPLFWMRKHHSDALKPPRQKNRLPELQTREHPPLLARHWWRSVNMYGSNPIEHASSCGRVVSDPLQKRVLGGSMAFVGEIPWQVTFLGNLIGNS